MIGSNASRAGDYVEFRNNPKSDVEDYLSKAIKSPCPFSIRSSIPEVFKNAEKAAKDANSTVKFFQGVGAISAIALIIALGALFFQVFTLVREKDDVINKATNKLESLEKDIKLLEGKIIDLNKQIEKNSQQKK